MAAVASAVVAGCTGSTPEGDAPDGSMEEFTRDEARAMGGKNDTGFDICEWMGWYDDDVCDEFCPDPDPVCAGTCDSDDDCPQIYCVRGPCPQNVCVDGECVVRNPAQCGDGTFPVCTRVAEPCPDGLVREVSGGCYGECVDPDTCEPPALETCGGDLDRDCPEGQYCDMGEPGLCPDDSPNVGVCRDAGDVCAAVIDPVCGCDGVTYQNACQAHQMGVTVASEEACGRPACGTRGGEECPLDMFCDFPDGSMCGAADEGGTCKPTPEFCTREFRPVCGCNGRTYSNACNARAAGTDVLHDGECEGSPEGEGQCGGLAGLTCASDEWCDYEDDAMCGAADRLGTCRKKPDLCPAVINPVCGCNGVSFDNACKAQRAGVDVASPGECEPHADCRTMGCDDGDECQFCWGTFQCIPEGAMC